MEPARSIIAALGGVDAVRKECGVHFTSVYKWMKPRTEKGGTDGKIPGRHQQTLLDMSDRIGADLTPQDFFRRTEGANGSGEG